MKTKKNKAKIRVNKLNHNPLFVKFLNWEGDKYSMEKMLTDLSENFTDPKDSEVAKARVKDLDDDYLNSLSSFQKVFQGNVKQTISANGISKDFVAWMDNAFKYVEEKVSTYANDESRSIGIKDPEGRWFEGIIIYNFIMTFNYFGANIIKQCPVCSSFFSHKGKYAKYCSDGCKTTGMKK